jgi:hypothetical protein
MGSANAAVLPLPVLARPMTLSPARMHKCMREVAWTGCTDPPLRIAGMQRAWILVGRRIPSVAQLSTSHLCTPRSCAEGRT